MLCGQTRILSRIKWWLFGPKTKMCKGFCPTCRFYKRCVKEVDYLEELFGEPFE